MLKKDLGLVVLIVVVVTVVGFLNPLFLSPINVANTANLVGLFGISAIGQAFVIITGGIDLSVGSEIALLGVLFVDLIVNHGVPWPLVLVAMLALGMVLGLIHGLLITRMNLQPFIVTLCGLLIYRGVARFYTADATAGFAFGDSFPTLDWLTIGRTYGIPHSATRLARTRRPRAIPASTRGRSSSRPMSSAGF
jgi:ribose transport system permease protein